MRPSPRFSASHRLSRSLKRNCCCYPLPSPFAFMKKSRNSKKPQLFFLYFSGLLRCLGGFGFPLSANHRDGHAMPDEGRGEWRNLEFSHFKGLFRQGIPTTRRHRVFLRNWKPRLDQVDHTRAGSDFPLKKWVSSPSYFLFFAT